MFKLSNTVNRKNVTFLAVDFRGENKKSSFCTFLTFVFVANDDFVHVDVLLVCTCEETGEEVCESADQVRELHFW